MASIRAAQLQHSLIAIERIAGAAHDRVLARMRAETLARIRETSRFDWLPIEHDLELVGAVAAELGPDAERERSRRSILLSLEGPLLRPFIAGVQTIFGFEPASLIRQTPRAWSAVYHDAGQVEYVVGRGAERILVYTDIPAPVVASALYLDAIAGALEAIYVLCEVEGRVTVENVDQDQRRAEFWFSWY